VLLDPRFVARLERLAILMRHRTAGTYAGEHRSRGHGASIDFADWRPYVAGDDFRRIDYQIYARLDRLLIRLYEAEEELLVRVVLDASASMGFEGKGEYAKQVAAALVYLAAARRNRCRVWVLSDSEMQPGPWARSREGALALFGWLEGVEPRGEGRLAPALRRMASAGGLPGMTVVISDLLDEDWEAALRTLAGPRAEAAVIHLLSGVERDPSERGDLLLVDSESPQASLEVSMSDAVLRQYRQRAESWLRAVAETCRRRGIRYAIADPAQPLESLILRSLRAEGLVG
jgi:uncharacterized protein (DUF58 family)